MEMKIIWNTVGNISQWIACDRRQEWEEVSNTHNYREEKLHVFWEYTDMEVGERNVKN